MYNLTVFDFFCVHRFSAYLFGGDLHAHVPAGHHDGVGLEEDLVVVADPFLVLDLGDDLRTVETGGIGGGEGRILGGRLTTTNS